MTVAKPCALSSRLTPRHDRQRRLGLAAVDRRFGRRRSCQRAFASARIIAAAFSAIIIVGAAVLPEVMRGITDASATRSPSTPRTRSRASTTAVGIVVAAHLRRADRMEDRRADVAGGLDELGVARRAAAPGRYSCGRKRASAGCRRDAAGEPDRIDGDAASSSVER